MRSVVDWIANPASGVNCSMRRAIRSGNAPRKRNGRKMTATPVAIAAPEWRTIVPMPSASSAYAVRSSAVPTTARGTPGSVSETVGYAGAT
jgi:hypothetical protein